MSSLTESGIRHGCNTRIFCRSITGFAVNIHPCLQAAGLHKRLPVGLEHPGKLIPCGSWEQTEEIASVYSFPRPHYVWPSCIMCVLHVAGALAKSIFLPREFRD